MQLEEIVYRNRDNAIDLRLSSDGVAITHTSITRCQVLVGTTLIDSQTTPTAFDLTQADRISLKLGSSGLAVGRYPATLYVFDASHANGLVWGDFTILAK